MKETRPLRAYAEVSLGRQRSPEHAEGPFMVPYLRAANVKDGELDLNDVLNMNFSPKEQTVFALRSGDVLVTEGSGSLSSVGASAVWNDDLPGLVCFQNTLLRLRPRGNTDPRFLAWWCRHAFASGQFASVATGANIFHLSAERVRSLPMTWVPLPEQRAIADYLDRETARIDLLHERQKRLLNLLNERVDAWIKARIADSSLVNGDGRAAIPLKRVVEKRCRLFHAGAPVVTAYRDGEVNARETRRAEGYTLAATTDSYQGVLVGDIVIHGLDGFAGAIGVSRANGCCSPVYHVCQASRGNDARYLARLLRVLAVDGYLGLHSTSVRERAVDFRNWNLMGAIPLPDVPQEEQRKVGEMIDAVGPVTALSGQMAALLLERRQALITRAVTGEIGIPVAA